MSNILISHIDLDGISCIILSRIFHIKYDRIYAWNNEYYENDVLDKASTITFTDLSISEDVYHNLINKGKRVIIYDHHETSNYLKNKNNVDTNRCGTKIYFDNISKKQFVKENIKKYVNLVDTYDRWQTDNILWEESLDLQRLFNNLVRFHSNALIYSDDYICPTVYKIFIKLMLNKLCGTNTFEYINTERERIEAEKEKERKTYKNAIKNVSLYDDEKNKRYGVYQTTGPVSLISNQLLNEFDMDYIIITYPWDKRKLSIRSKKNFNCLQFVGINGHKNAAGGIFECDYINDLLNGKVKLTYKQ